MKNNNDVNLERVFEKPIKIFGKQLKVMRVVLISLVSILYGGSLFYETASILGLIFAIVAFVLFTIMSFLLYKRILYFGEYCLECSPAGDLFLTKLHGHCSKCDGHLRIKKNKKASFIQCNKNPKHVWNLFEHEKKEEVSKK